MSPYLTPFPRMFAGAVQTALNRAMALDPAAANRLQAMADGLIGLELQTLGINLYFCREGERLAVSAESESEPDTWIRGTPSALLAMAVPAWKSPGSGVTIEGDAGLARGFEGLLGRLDPDWEAALVARFGAVAGHQIFVLIRETGRGGRRTAETLGDQAARYLREESGLVVGRAEYTEFSRAVDELREAADRLAARVERSLRS